MSANKIKHSFLNIVISAAVILLFFVTVIAIERNNAQKQYEILADQRASQFNDESDAASAMVDSGKSSKSAVTDTDKSQTDKVVENTEPSEVLKSFVYVENKNKDFISINSDFIGWLNVPGSNIDYPFVRSKDNNDYLKRDFYGNFSESGTLFMDYRNIGNFIDKHTLIYGHNMKNKSMFHALLYYKNEAFFLDNQEIYLSGLYESRTYRIFSVYEISADNYAFSLNFDNESDYMDYLKYLEELSLHRQDIEFNPNQRLLTLVTCSYGVNNGRTIVHAVEVSE